MRIHLLRGRRVMLDFDLAEVYGVPTMRLNEQVTRNLDRFPSDFMFRLQTEEWRSLISQIAISNVGRGGRRKPPRAFTEHGAVMLASVLNTPTAVQASVAIVRAFNRMRHLSVLHKELAQRLRRAEARLDGHDADLRAVLAALEQLTESDDGEPNEIGFKP